MAGNADDDALWNGERGAGGISWADRSSMGLLRGVIDAADVSGRRNAYMHALHTIVLTRELSRAGILANALDFGCGTGRFIGLLSKFAQRVVAADKEQSMVDAARNHAGHYGAEIVCCDPAKLPFDAATFDFTLCSSVLCVTIRPLLQDIVAEMARVTRPGGTLLLLEQVRDDRNLPISQYYKALASAGFQVVRSYPIRSGTSSFTTWTARNSWIPAKFFPALAAIELRLTRGARSQNESSYTEYGIVARR